MITPRSAPFHSYVDRRLRAQQVFHPQKGWHIEEGSKHTQTQDRQLSYRFTLHAHPYVADLVSRLVNFDIPGLQAASIDYVKKNKKLEPLRDDLGEIQTLADGSIVPRPVLYKELFTDSSYDPGPLVEHPYPVMDIDFTSDGAYSGYNWELFYHIPMTIAIHLSQNQRFEDAQKWFHYVFDPTDDSDGPTPERFWKLKPFQCTDAKMVEQVLVNLSTGNDPALAQETINAIDAWKHNPFRPFLVARYRQSAFQFKAVMAYLDNLIAWGDSLFLQYTGETINEAAQIYILAANLLGPRPQPVPKNTSAAPMTYASLRSHLDAFGNELVNLESEIPFHASPHPRKPAKSSKLNSVTSVGGSQYFCTPPNAQLLQYWDTVADRLFKIRNSLNMQGIFQQVPLFDPPIDPALLARAVAEGLNITDIVSGINQPLPLVRFQYLIQKATEACGEVKSLGGNLLSAIEKNDNESLSLLRAGHETKMLQLAETIKYSAWQEAIKNREGLEQSLTNTKAKYTYYQKLQGKKDSEFSLERMEPIHKEGLEKFEFDSKEPTVSQQNIDYNIATTLDIGGSSAITKHEAAEMVLAELAQGAQQAAHGARATASAMRPIPDPDIHLHFWGLGGKLKNLPGGTQLSAIADIAAEIASATGDALAHAASDSLKIGGYVSRNRDFQFQANAAAGEITQMYKQLRAAQIREAMAEREWKNHQKQIAQSQAIEQFLTDKPSNKALYAWMKREVKGLYNSTFQFAFEIAKKAERAIQQELGDPTLSYIQYGYLAGKEGLLAGEKLYQDIKRMEMAYAELNRREYELTKHVSLLQLDPLALLQLRMTGTCTITIPEELFDFDCPGHYFRRIRSVALTIPCVAGPYTSINCRLTLLKSSIRISTDTGESGYPRDGASDNRFSDFFGSAQSIVTSTAQNDSGIFDARDERKVPFEYSGAISQWQLVLPKTIQQFDYSTISDVILHLRYTAREGGDPLLKPAVDNLTSLIGSAQSAGSVRLFSMRHEFPSDWARFKGTKPSAPNALMPLTFTLLPEHYPFWSQQWLQAILGISVVSRTAKDGLNISDTPDGTGNTDSLPKDHRMTGIVSGSLKKIPMPPPTGPVALYLDDNSMTDLWFAISWAQQSS